LKVKFRKGEISNILDKLWDFKELVNDEYYINFSKQKKWDFELCEQLEEVLDNWFNDWQNEKVFWTLKWNIEGIMINYEEGVINHYEDVVEANRKRHVI
jgi:hypothetical protein